MKSKFLKVKPLGALAALSRSFSASSLNENAPHSLGRGGKEMTPAVPLLLLVHIHQPHIRFMHQCRCLQGLTGLLLRKFLSRQLAQLLIDEWQKLLGRVRVALLDGIQDLGDIAHKAVNPSDKLITNQPGVFDPFLPQSKRREFAEFRADLKLLISPVGGAVNKGNNFSSYNLTCERHLTEDRSDSGTGAFLCHPVRVNDFETVLH